MLIIPPFFIVNFLLINMENLQLLIYALEKAVKHEVFNQLEIKTIQDVIEKISTELNKEQDEKDNKNN
ncbi:hypothetical protein SAMN05421761_10763 [Belliella pelovolcani]|uniref:Uncharacterized protein n=2 Tax=Belliella pelovolcani TaxID=529505 RepID=A0A1N7MRJ4_9BACT|nr:hypothetical protein SAMN05421761_10763 [Belliella pelovolcani]